MAVSEMNFYASVQSLPHVSKWGRSPISGITVKATDGKGASPDPLI